MSRLFQSGQLRLMWFLEECTGAPVPFSAGKLLGVTSITLAVHSVEMESSVIMWAIFPMETDKIKITYKFL